MLIKYQFSRHVGNPWSALNMEIIFQKQFFMQTLSALLSLHYENFPVVFFEKRINFLRDKINDLF